MKMNKIIFLLHTVETADLKTPIGSLAKEIETERMARTIGFKHIFHFRITKGSLFQKHKICQKIAENILAEIKKCKKSPPLFANDWELFTKAISSVTIVQTLKDNTKSIHDMNELYEEAARNNNEAFYQNMISEREETLLEDLKNLIRKIFP